ncbi:rod shape-determining protein RodA [Candidatus Pelagibacter sp.]|jgi:rod shape determining protein RodA|uniref:rod shape-determining protein RodA n=1 Tax=uncultured Candidatus Pelagibacter sp. TaxID=372654 RepID=UPI0023244EEB|nr:rod shape-determining protein RodA [uncultured Candidatus Pelagibacter sp.]MDA7588338.1 rod shape-determining protein RodA [Candidatus Pelagibacter sp.]MDC3216112.1 rod shape-determining protein RodA [bacterium]MDB3946795.1 rod shape-determining protein RodA [Candidatus Pelagibacter sp.]MDB4811882.1 rod shape-determining protein RodA [Candidatus Pelagibacter sp.]MDC0405294.1 rod shape-determining protein RodA [Candidatus Pelagibacter sp.]
MYHYRRLNSDQSFFQKIKNLDYILLICILALSTLSFFIMYSTDGGEFLYHSKSHLIKLVTFFILMIVISFFNIKFWHLCSYFLYGAIILLLVWVSIYGLKVSGSQRWIDLYFLVLQPSELMKIGIILCLAKYYHRVSIEKVNSFLSISIALSMILIPIFFVLSQPDLGTSILIVTSGLIVLWLGGVKIKYFFISFITFLISLPFIITSLEPYQKLRILTFLNPDRDPLGAGYQIIQSKIAIGSGGFSGKGFLQGTQSYLDFLPEKHTDFIFTLFSEEFGFVGSVGLLLLYTIIILRIIQIGSISRSNFARLFCFGFAFAIFIYITVNLSMVLGLLPIVGSPLPIMSYGGSSMLATMIGFGIVMSAKVHNQQTIA